MGVVSVATGCTCGTIGENPAFVRLCEPCHRYWRGDKQLVSVSHVLRSTWPFKADYSAAPADVLENARVRGSATDALFSAYVEGRLSSIPAGTRRDVVDLFLKLKLWWDTKHADDFAESQVLLADDAVAGTCDILTDDGMVYDLKCTHDIEAMYPIQLGAYADLHFAMHGKPVKGLGIIHVTKRYAEPKIIKIDVAEAVKDWLLIRDTYFMAHRRAGK